MDGRFIQSNVGGANTIYKYDADGRRIQKILASGDKSDFVYDLGGKIVTEFYNGGWARGYVHAGGRLLATYVGGGTQFSHADWLGTERVRTTATGGVYNSCASLPFGDGLTCTGGTDYVPLHFTGKERDAESGLDYFGARYYGSNLGRFDSVDPLLTTGRPLEPQSWNRYAYTLNNPMRYTDPDGLYEEDVHRDLTEVLALAAGYSESSAKSIAGSDQGVDDSPVTNPFDGDGDIGEAARRDYHFTSPSRRADMWKDAVNANLSGDEQLKSLGVYLHAEQDSYSHDGYSAATGHLMAGTAPDKTYLQPAKANAMAKDTYFRLRTAADSTGNAKFQPVAWSKIDSLVQAFNAAVVYDKKGRVDDAATRRAKKAILAILKKEILANRKERKPNQ